MARQRLLSPEFFVDQKVCSLQPLERLLFQGLWTLADREGKLVDQPFEMKLKLMPVDNIDIDAALWHIADAGLIVRYQVGSQQLILIPNFLKFQNPHHRENKSTLPFPEKPGASRGRAQVEPRASLTVPVTVPVTVTDPVISLSKSKAPVQESFLPGPDDSGSDDDEEPSERLPSRWELLWEKLCIARRVHLMNQGVASELIDDEEVAPAMVNAGLKRACESLKLENIDDLEGIFEAYMLWEVAGTKSPPYPLQLFLTPSVLTNAHKSWGISQRELAQFEAAQAKGVA